MTADPQIALEAKGLRISFGTQVVLDGVDLEAKRGEILGVVGASGSGKSVLLRTIIGLLRPEAGSVKILGHDMSRLGSRERRDLERRWGVLFQDGALFSSLTVAQNVEVPLTEYLELPRALMDEIAGFKVSMVGLPCEAAPKYPSELSGGMRKRAGLARALALDPEILFLDEPTSGLDPISAAGLDDLIKRLHETLGLTVVLVTHDLSTLASICHRIAVLVEGRVISVGSLADMVHAEHPWIRDYFHGPRAQPIVASADT